MTATTCWTCGTTYTGFTCPNCYAIEQSRKRAAEQQEEAERLASEGREAYEAAAEQIASSQMAAAALVAEAQHEAARNIEMATERAAEAHVRTVANAWSLEADSKTSKAYELYRAGMLDDAIALATNAAQQDPTNLDAQKVLAWSFEAKGAEQEAHAHYEKQLAILTLPAHRDSIWAFIAVIKGLPADPTLDAKAKALYGQLHRARGKGNTHLIVALRERGWIDEALLAARNVAPDSNEALENHAWALELGGHQDEDETNFARWLAGYDVNHRGHLEQQARDVLSKDMFSGITKRKIRSAIAAVRESWRDAIAAEFSGKARKRSQEAYKEKKDPKLVGCAVFLGSVIFLGPCVIGTLLPRGSNPLDVPIVWLLAVLASVAGYLVLKHRLTQKRSQELFTEEYNSLWKSEEQGWARVLTLE